MAHPVPDLRTRPKRGVHIDAPIAFAAAKPVKGDLEAALPLGIGGRDVA